MNTLSKYPKYILFVADKNNSKDKTRAGAAFVNEFGGLNLKLSPGVVLKWDDEVYFNLNPYESKRAYARRMQTDGEDTLHGDPPGGDELQIEPEEEYFSDLPEELLNDDS